MSEVPIVLHPDGRDRPPHLRTFRDGWRHLRFLLLMSPRWLFLIPAVFLLLLGGAGAALGGLGAPDWGLPLLAVVCVAASAQALWLWIFARLFGRAGAWLEHLTLERALVLGTGLVLGGSAVLVWAASTGNEAGTTAFDSTAARCWVSGAGLLLLGAQVVFNAFFLEFLRSAVAARPEGERAPEPSAVPDRMEAPRANGTAVP
jgi:hypothetical protein